MSRLFNSFRGDVAIVGQPPSGDQMAADLAEETCLRLAELRAEALRREEAAEPPMLETAELKECYATLDALCKGRHAWVVKPIIMEHFPEITRPPTDAEKAAVEKYLADNPHAVTP